MTLKHLLVSGLPSCLCMSVCLPTTYLPTYLPTHPPTHLPTYLHTYIHIHTYIHTYITDNYLPTYVLFIYPFVSLPACPPRPAPPSPAQPRPLLPLYNLSSHINLFVLIYLFIYLSDLPSYQHPYLLIYFIYLFIYLSDLSIHLIYLYAHLSKYSPVYPFVQTHNYFPSLTIHIACYIHARVIMYVCTYVHSPTCKIQTTQHQRAELQKTALIHRKRVI
jgi:hypothetical protein